MDDRKVTIGNKKNPYNDIKLNDLSISGDHLEVRMIDENQCLITDLGSTNHTYVNDVEIVSKVIGKSDIILLGESRYTGEELMLKVKTFLNTDKVVFYKEFEEMESIFKEYNDRKKKIKNTNITKSSALKYGIIGVMLGTFYIGSSLFGWPEQVRYGCSILGGIIALFINQKLFSKGDLAIHLEALRDEFAQKLICPKCLDKQLVGNTYEYWKRQRKCNKCQANWVK